MHIDLIDLINDSRPDGIRFFSIIIMQAKAIVFVALATLGQARFGQEGAVQGIIQALSDFGPPGAAGTLAGQTTGVLLAGASACAKVRGIR